MRSQMKSVLSKTGFRINGILLTLQSALVIVVLFQPQVGTLRLVFWFWGCFVFIHKNEYRYVLFLCFLSLSKWTSSPYNNPIKFYRLSLT